MPGVYDTWVHRLTELGKNPDTPLDSLPTISDEVFNPATIQRLLKHVDRTNSKIMEKWEEDLKHGQSQVRSRDDFALLMVRSRKLLSKRVELATHPALPQAVRDSLYNEVEASIRDLQNQLEKSFLQGQSVSRIDSNSMLGVLRDNPLTAVLSPDYGRLRGVGNVGLDNNLPGEIESQVPTLFASPMQVSGAPSSPVESEQPSYPPQTSNSSNRFLGLFRKRK